MYVFVEGSVNVCVSVAGDVERVEVDSVVAVVASEDVLGVVWASVVV